MNSFGSRQERIEMVRGLAMPDASQKQDEKPKKTFNNGPGEETESTMTHAEIEAFA